MQLFHWRLGPAAIGAALILAAMGAPSAGAAPQCVDEMQAVAAKIPGIPDARIRDLATFDIQRAKRELAEGDEDECQEAIDHAKELIAGKY
jgi:hypothetical protein